ncbi:hypothetical protein GLOIN_2v1514915, partial [Rhizophagus irregularis DAOM 181602=DAOM 197198]
SFLLVLLILHKNSKVSHSFLLSTSSSLSVKSSSQPPFAKSLRSSSSSPCCFDDSCIFCTLSSTSLLRYLDSFELILSEVMLEVMMEVLFCDFLADILSIKQYDIMLLLFKFAIIDQKKRRNLMKVSR